MVLGRPDRTTIRISLMLRVTASTVNAFALWGSCWLVKSEDWYNYSGYKFNFKPELLLENTVKNQVYPNSETALVDFL